MAKAYSAGFIASILRALVIDGRHPQVSPDNELGNWGIQQNFWKFNDQNFPEITEEGRAHLRDLFCRGF